MSQALFLPDQAQQQVLGANIAVAQFPCRLLGKPQGLLSPGRKFVFIHVQLPPFGEIRCYFCSLCSLSSLWISSRSSAARSKFSWWTAFFISIFKAFIWRK